VSGGLTALGFVGRVVPTCFNRQRLDERADRLQDSDKRERDQSDDDHGINVLPAHARLKRSRTQFKRSHARSRTVSSPLDRILRA
jgi:hypothetical protein